MSFYSTESSQHDSEPIELYTFTTNLATYRYTSGPEDYVYDGNTYTRIPITREALKIVKVREKQELGVQMPIDIEIVNELGQLIAPINSSMNIRRIHPATAETEVIWRGRVTRVDIKGRFAKLVCPPLLAVALETSYPSRVFSRFCGHQLFDDRCGLAKASFDYTGTIATITGNQITISADAGDPNSPQNLGPVQRFSGGEIIRVSDGEKRRIVRQGDYTTTGSYPGTPSSSSLARTFYLNMPFRDLEVGDSVTIYPGCSKSAFDCKNKFNNIAKFGGFPLTPVKNVYTATGGVKGVG